MDLQYLTIGSFFLFTAAVGAGTWMLTRRDLHDTSTAYFLAGRTLTGGFIAGSLLLTNLSTEQLVGLNGAAFGDGLAVMAWEVIAGASLVVMALFFLPRYLKSGIATVPDFLARRYNEATRAITSLIFIVAYAGILLPIVLYTGALGLNEILDLPGLLGLQSHVTLTMGVWFIGLVGSAYAIFGGLRTVAVSDTLNGFGLLLGGALITILGLNAISSGDPLDALRILRESHPEKFNSVGGPESSVPFSTLFTGVLLLNLFYWCTNQQIIQRTFGASSLAEGQRGVLLAGTFKVLAPLILVLPGIIAFHLFADQGIHPDDAYGMLVRHVLPWWLTGFFAAVLVGAILSSFNSALNSTATLFSLGVYPYFARAAVNDRSTIRAGKVSGCIVALAAMIGAPLLIGQESIFAYLQKMNGLYFIPIFSVVLVGILHRRVPAGAANLALVLGFTAIALGYFVPQLAVWVDRMHEFHFLGLVFVLLVALMLAGGLWFPRATPWKHEYSGDVDLTPWRFAWPYGIALLLLVVGLYAWFADLSVLIPNGD